MNTEITNALKATSDTAQYDNSAKSLLGNKYILAQILVYTVDEFKGMQPMDVIDDIVQRIKRQALSGNGFTEGENRQKRIPMKATNEEDLSSPQSIERMQNELLYLRQEVEFLKKIIIADNSRKRD